MQSTAKKYHQYNHSESVDRLCISIRNDIQKVSTLIEYCAYTKQMSREETLHSEITDKIKEYNCTRRHLNAEVTNLENIGIDLCISNENKENLDNKYAGEVSTISLEIRNIINKSYEYITKHSDHTKRDYVGVVIVDIIKLETLEKQVQAIATPFEQLVNQQERIERLKMLIESINLIDDLQLLQMVKAKFSKIEHLISNDTLIEREKKLMIEELFKQKIEESVCMQYIAMCEFYSLIMHLVSSGLNNEAYENVYSIMQNKIKTIALNRKIEYYAIFIEIMNIHDENIVILNQLTKRMQVDLESCQSEDSNIEAIKQILELSIECYTKIPIDTKDKRIFILSQLENLEQIDKLLANDILRTVYIKLCITSTAKLVASEVKLASAHKCFPNISSIFKPANVIEDLKTFCDYIWHEPSTSTEKLQDIYQEIEKYPESSFTEDNSWLFHDLNEKYWQEGELDQESIHVKCNNEIKLSDDLDDFIPMQISVNRT